MANPSCQSWGRTPGAVVAVPPRHSMWAAGVDVLSFYNSKSPLVYAGERSPIFDIQTLRPFSSD